MLKCMCPCLTKRTTALELYYPTNDIPRLAVCLLDADWMTDGQDDDDGNDDGDGKAKKKSHQEDRRQ